MPFVFISTDQVSLNFTPTSAKASKLASKFFHLNDKRVGNDLSPQFLPHMLHHSPVSKAVVILVWVSSLVVVIPDLLFTNYKVLKY